MKRARQGRVKSAWAALARLASILFIGAAIFPGAPVKAIAAGVALGPGFFDFSGFVAPELRMFPVGPANPDQDDTTFSPSIAFQPEVRYEWNRDRDRITLIPFLRLDADDGERSHHDLRELSGYHNAGDWDLLMGFGKVFWGVTESRHLVDIINQTDLVEDLDGEDKLGQPMINVNFLRDWGTVGLFILPGFRERTFPAGDARLRGGLPVAVKQAVFADGADDLRVDYALRWSHTLGDWDVGIYEFYGTGREPRLVFRRDSKGREELVPHYDTIDQTGLDVQWTKGSWLWKLEAIIRGGQGDRFGAFVAGVEYTFFGIFGTVADLGALMEYLHDGRDGDAPSTPFDNDILTGLRLVLNDAQSTEALAGTVLDWDKRSVSVNFEADRRLGDRWKLEVISRAILRVSSEDILFGNRNDDFIQIRLSRFF